MIIIPSPDRPDLFAINVFRVRPENQQRLVDRIRDAGDPAGIPGLLSMHLLRSKDGTLVANHIHWASRTALSNATGENPVIDATKKAIREYIEGTGPMPYEVIRL